VRLEIAIDVERAINQNVNLYLMYIVIVMTVKCASYTDRKPILPGLLYAVSYKAANETQAGNVDG